MNDSNPQKPKRRRYQFSLRTLLVLGLLVMSGCEPSEEERRQQATDAYLRGLDYYEEREYDKAIAEYTEAIRLAFKQGSWPVCMPLCAAGSGFSGSLRPALSPEE